MLARFEEERRANGLSRALGESLAVVYGYAAFPMIRTNRRPESFWLGGREYRYVRHPYNRAWLNERSVELALALDFLHNAEGRTLELGNVTSHYTEHPKDVVDKYEDYPGVINSDIVDYKAATPYNNILSISTLEHVGWDESPRNPKKILQAHSNLLSLLSPGGRLLVTCPLGYNPNLDRYVLDGSLRFDETQFLRRVSRHNIWVEANRSEVQGVRYGEPFPNANAIVVGRVGGS